MIKGTDVVSQSVRPHYEDTIAAIATAPGEAGIAVVRISGPQALAIADTIFHCRAPKPSARPARTFVFGHVMAANGERLDAALLLIMRAPHSYTGENAIELQCHGGRIPARRILRRALEAGARAAEPGEFTRRAFLNGRMDLAQAEAVQDLIRAKSERAAAAAMEQLAGRLSHRLNQIYTELMAAAAEMEASLDFPDDEMQPIDFSNVRKRMEAGLNAVRQLASTWEEGHYLRDGLKVVIAGRPNVGKSTLMNLLLGKPRSIVSDMPGTTRDLIEEELVLDGIPIRLVDTAGLRESDCKIEVEGVQRAKSALELADLFIYVIDASKPLNGDDIKNLGQLNQSRTIVILNKIDLGQKVKAEDIQWRNMLSISIIQLNDNKPITSMICSIIENNIHFDEHVHAVVSERHLELLNSAIESIKSSLEMFDENNESSIVPSTIMLKDAIESLGMITGRVYSDELLDNIFSRFCIGK